MNFLNWILLWFQQIFQTKWHYLVTVVCHCTKLEINKLHFLQLFHNKSLFLVCQVFIAVTQHGKKNTPISCRRAISKVKIIFHICVAARVSVTKTSSCTITYNDNSFVVKKLWWSRKFAWTVWQTLETWQFCTNIQCKTTNPRVHATF